MKWWRSVLAMEVRKIFAYRSDFWITFLGQTIIQLLIATSLWKSIFEAQGTTEMQGYTLPMMSLYYLLVPIGTRMLSGENIGFISREIYDGSFGRYLIYPLSPFQYKAVTYLTYSAFYGLQLILMYGLFHVFWAKTPPQFGSLLLGLLVFFAAAAVYMAMAMLVELISLWADNVWALMVMLRFFTAFLGGGFIPLAFFPEGARQTLTWTPFPYLVALPVRTIMGLATMDEVLKGMGFLLLWGMVLNGLRLMVWEKGQRRFTGVGV